MTTETSQIYIPLLDEGTLVIRPTEGKQVKENIFLILPTENYDPSAELWMFPPGSIVECKREIWENEEVWVARNSFKDLNLPNKVE
ncbi:MAG: hypothetical protein KC445_11600 [Anaerolineales bacterium]|nr:hypothetical protein [Anaerolineales bacterium]